MPRFNEKTIDEIKNKLTISDVMENYAHVEYKGGSKWVKCPFHGGGNEKTASCKLDDERGTFYCFGCHASGDIFTLVMKKEGLDFASSVETLAKKCGVTIDESYSSSQEGKKKNNEKMDMYDMYDRVMKSFHYILLEKDIAKDAREYLRKRNVSPEMIETFALGFAPSDPSWLYNFLSSKGYSPSFLSQSGFFSQKNPKWPLFNNRLMFPVRDRLGRCIAFSGRDLSFSDKAPKYINSPETLIYQKKENYFGLYEAKKTISDKVFDPILVEGNFDVVAMHQAGFTSAVASLGTSFTLEQCSNMKKWFPSISSFHMLYDSDQAGQNSTVRAIGIINKNGLGQCVHKLSSAKDASELLEKKGESGVKEEFSNYLTGFEYLVQNSLSRYDIKTAKGKSDFIKSLGEYLNNCQSEVERDSYILSLANLLTLDEEAIKEDLKRIHSAPDYKVKEESGKKELREIRLNVSHDLYLMLYLCNHRSLFKVYRNKINFGDLEDSDAQKLYMALENAMRDDVQSDSLFLTYVNDEDLRNYVSASYALKEYTEERNEAFLEVMDRINLRSLERKSNALLRQIAMLSPDDSTSQEEFLSRKIELDTKIANLKKSLKF